MGLRLPSDNGRAQLRREASAFGSILRMRHGRLFCFASFLRVFFDSFDGSFT